MNETDTGLHERPILEAVNNTWVTVNAGQMIDFWVQTDMGLNLNSSSKKGALFVKKWGE